MIIFGNLDNWKTEAPEDESENTCSYCGEPCDGDFCNKEHLKAYFND